ncbi:hypothetical protein QEO94_01225 [Kingella negevensis]|uniref:hypothetical protein n=1 Tax=Kingella negevensis TaxID=1522312 RepID=UPI00254341AF|nr:hypothetical protein [Kingella negevensis]WII93501.1 hypothetical protein QEO94_01225 [Kingella negevensis]
MITHDVLESPGTYFGGAYPICEQFTGKADRIASHVEQVQKTIQKVKDWAKTTFGGVWNMYFQYFPNMTPNEIMEELKPDHERLPKGLSGAALSSELDETQYLHERLANEQNIPTAQKLDNDYQRAETEEERIKRERLEEAEAEIWAAYERSRKNRKEAFKEPRSSFTLESFSEMINEVAQNAIIPDWAEQF